MLELEGSSSLQIDAWNMDLANLKGLNKGIN